MFICTKCGLCCRNINKIPELASFHNGDGICKYLTKDNLCAIYSIRPNICNVSKMYELKYKLLMSREEYEQMNTDGCKTLQNCR